MIRTLSPLRTMSWTINDDDAPITEKQSFSGAGLEMYTPISEKQSLFGAVLKTNTPISEQQGFLGANQDNTTLSTENRSFSGSSTPEAFEERIVDKLLKAQSKQFEVFRGVFAKKKLKETNKRIDELIASDGESDNEVPPEKSRKRTEKGDNIDGPSTDGANSKDDGSVISRLSKQYDITKNGARSLL